MKQVLTFCFLLLTSFLLRGSTCTWTGTAGDNMWQTADNWSCGSVPTASDDVIFTTFNLVAATSNISINSLSLGDGIALTGNAGLTFSANSITYNSTSNGLVTSRITGFVSATVSEVTLNAPNINLISLELQNGILTGAVNTNAQALKLTGITALNTGCSFSGGTLLGNGVEFNNAIVTVNSNINISCSTRFMGGSFMGTGSFTLGSGAVIFGGALPPTLINVPITINNTLSGANALNCANIVFSSTVTLNASSGSFYFSVVGNSLQSLEFRGALNSNKAFSISGITGSLVKFTNATVDIDGTTEGMSVSCDAVIINTTFNDNTGFTGTTDFQSGIFNSRLDIGSSMSPSKVFTIRSSGAKSILGFTEIASTVNWEAGLITKNSATQIIVDAGATFNVSAADGFSQPFSGSLTNNGTINYNCSLPNNYCVFPLRTWNTSLGTINLNNTANQSHLQLFGYDNEGTINIASRCLLSLGGENQAHYLRGNITGSGMLAISLGAHNLTSNFSTGSLSKLELYGGAYIFSSVSSAINLTTTSATLLSWLDAWMTIPLNIQGTAQMMSGTHGLSNTVTVNGILNWNGGTPYFHTNGKINITSIGTMNNNFAGSTGLEANATNADITNCGTIKATAIPTITVPFLSCTTGVVTCSNALNFVSNYHNAGTIKPGCSPGTTVINPSVSSASTAVYEMEIIGGYGVAGTMDDADKLQSAGDIVLNGTLKVSLNNPTADNYTLFNSTGGSVTGFNNLTILYSVNGGAFTSTVPPRTNFQINTTNIVFQITGTVLPVELTAFKGKNTEGGNLLTWQTASEANTSDFDIERSNDGQIFEKIGKTKAEGKATNYNYLDKYPLSITTYYRLKINDLDGKNDYSNIVSIATKTKEKLNIFPNPVSAILTINVVGDGFQIYNLLGQEVIRGQATKRVDVSALPQGAYLLKVGAEQVRFVKE